MNNTKKKKKGGARGRAKSVTRRRSKSPTKLRRVKSLRSKPSDVFTRYVNKKGEIKQIPKGPPNCTKNHSDIKKENCFIDPINLDCLTKDEVVQNPTDDKKCFNRNEICRWLRTKPAGVNDDPETRKNFPAGWQVENCPNPQRTIDQEVRRNREIRTQRRRPSNTENTRRFQQNEARESLRNNISRLRIIDDSLPMLVAAPLNTSEQEQDLEVTTAREHRPTQALRANRYNHELQRVLPDPPLLNTQILDRNSAASLLDSTRTTSHRRRPRLVIVDSLSSSTDPTRRTQRIRNLNDIERAQVTTQLLNNLLSHYQTRPIEGRGREEIVQHRRTLRGLIPRLREQGYSIASDQIGRALEQDRIGTILERRARAAEEEFNEVYD